MVGDNGIIHEVLDSVKRESNRLKKRSENREIFVRAVRAGKSSAVDQEIIRHLEQRISDLEDSFLELCEVVARNSKRELDYSIIMAVGLVIILAIEIFQTALRWPQ